VLELRVGPVQELGAASVAPSRTTVQVQSVERILVGVVVVVVVGVGAAAGDGVGGQEAAGGGVLEAYSHEGKAGEGLVGALLAAQPGVAGGRLSRPRVAELVGVQDGGRDGDVGG
jgi:hypothetical protein